MDTSVKLSCHTCSRKDMSHMVQYIIDAPDTSLPYVGTTTAVQQDFLD